MPLYEYECSTCGHKFEELVQPGQAEQPGPECPKCKEPESRRTISATAKCGSGIGSAPGGLGSMPMGGGCGGSGGFS